MERFWSKVDKTDTCWLWNAAKDPLGYGRFWFVNQMRLAHRIAYALEVGEHDEGLELDHLCRNPSCVNPAHLEPVTHRENIKRGKWRTHCPRGHALEGVNLLPSKQGRKCRACHNFLRSKANKQRSNQQ